MASGIRRHTRNTRSAAQRQSTGGNIPTVANQPSSSNTNEDHSNIFGSLLPPIELITETPAPEHSGGPQESGPSTNPARTHNDNSFEQLRSLSNTDPRVRIEEVSVEIPSQHHSYENEPSNGDAQPEPSRTYAQAAGSLQSDVVDAQLRAGSADAILRNRMSKITTEDNPSDGSEAASVLTSTPRYTATEKGKGTATWNHAPEDDQTFESTEPVNADRLAQIEHDANLAREIANREFENDLAGRSTLKEPVKTVPSDREREFLRVLRENEELKETVGRLSNHPTPSSDELPAASSRNRSTPHRNTGIPPLRHTARVAMPLASQNKPLAFGVPIVKKPPALPPTSGVARAIAGDPEDPNGPDSNPSSSNGEGKDSGELHKKKRELRDKYASPPSDPGDSSSSGSDSDNDIFREVPDSDHESDSPSTKKHKSRARRDYRRKIDKLKHQQAFLKSDLWLAGHRYAWQYESHFYFYFE